MGASCPATREAVLEQEERGEVGCPICGQSAESHPIMASDQPHGLEGPEDGQETGQGHDRTEGDGMGNIEHGDKPERLAVEFYGGAFGDPRLTTPLGPSLRAGEVEYVRADLHAGAVGRIAVLEDALDLAGTRLGEYRDYEGTREVEDALGRAIGGQ